MIRNILFFLIAMGCAAMPLTVSADTELGATSVEQSTVLLAVEQPCAPTINEAVNHTEPSAPPGAPAGSVDVKIAERPVTGAERCIMLTTHRANLVNGKRSAALGVQRPPTNV